MLELGALVLYAPDMQKTAEFYRTLGIPLEEDHGEGPLHYATESGSVHYAVYPARSPGSAPARHSPGDIFHGFYVDSLDAVSGRWKAIDAPMLSDHEVMPWGCRFVARDPDGRAVEVNQRGHCPSGNESV
jgi:catechol 2,3-dioxygenase-like lactoylglutathione lyase family enzyme